MPPSSYAESSIRVLKGLEPVKQRPGMYTRTDNPLHIVQEAIDKIQTREQLKAELLRQRPDLQVSELRGNVPTRLRRLEEGQFDAVVLACAWDLGQRGDWLRRAIQMYGRGS